MSNSSQSQNISKNDETLERKVGTFLTVFPCFIFLYINMVMLYSLRSKQVFRETSRYILLYNLLLTETFQLTLGQLFCILGTTNVYMVRYVCLTLVMLTIITTDMSPLNLTVMSLERYVAVCFPLRHATLVTIRSTRAVIALLWTVSSVNSLSRAIIVIFLDPAPLNSMMQDICSREGIYRLQIFVELEKGFMCALFVCVGLVIIFSYVNVILVAMSASSEKTLAKKASTTLVLHFIQLCLSLSTSLVTYIMFLIQGIVDYLTFFRIYFILFIFVINLPRCLSCLIYGLKDQTIRPILIQHLSLGLRRPAITVSKH